MDIDMVENKERKRFEAEVEGQIAFIEYIRAKNAVYLTHTEVPTALEGKGVGSALVIAVLNTMETEAHQIAPLCPFVAAYIRKHPQWKTLLAPNYNV